MSEYVLYTVLRKVDLGATEELGMLHPRYTQFGQKMKPYVGLRENALEAWKQRVLAPIPNAQPHEFLIIKVIFTAEGFMTYATDTYTSDDGNWSVPRFHKAFAYGNEYGAWRFYGGIPINATGITGAALVRLEAVKDWEIITASA